MSKKQKVLTTLAQILFYIIFYSSCLTNGLIIGAYSDILATNMILVIGIGLIIYGLSIYLQIIIHEFGHMIFGLLTGYKFRSIRFSSFMWVKLDGKIRFKRFSLPGTGGQCLMSPPDIIDGKMPFVLYNLGGVLLNLISSALFFALYLIAPNTYFGLFCIIMGIWGISSALQNGIPLDLPAISNDGSNILAISKSQTALRAFWLSMKINEALTDNIRIKDLPEKWFALTEEDDMSNRFAHNIRISRCDRLIDLHCFEEAADELISLLEDDTAALTDLIRTILINNLICCSLLSGKDKSFYEKHLNSKYDKMIKVLSKNISCIRTNYICELLVYNDPKAAEKALDSFNKFEKTYPYPCDYQTERELIEIATDLHKETMQ